jgi:hypothetical protein
VRAHKVITLLPFATRTAFTARTSDRDLNPVQTQKRDSFTRSCRVVRLPASRSSKLDRCG